MCGITKSQSTTLKILQITDLICRRNLQGSKENRSKNSIRITIKPLRLTTVIISRNNSIKTKIEIFLEETQITNHPNSIPMSVSINNPNNRQISKPMSVGSSATSQNFANKNFTNRNLVCEEYFHSETHLDNHNKNYHEGIVESGENEIEFSEENNQNFCFPASEKGPNI